MSKTNIIKALPAFYSGISILIFNFFELLLLLGLGVGIIETWLFPVDHEKEIAEYAREYEYLRIKD